MELHREIKTDLDISSAAVVMEYTYAGTSPKMAVIRVELGDATKPIQGGQNYYVSAKIDDVPVTPTSPVLVLMGQTQAILMTRAIVLEPDDVLTVEVQGTAGDIAINAISVVMDMTPLRASDVSGDGSIVVDHDYGETDALRVTSGGAGIDNVTIKAYRLADWTAGSRSSTFVVATAMTKADGRWNGPMSLDAGDYVLVFSKQGAFRAKTVEITIA